MDIQEYIDKFVENGISTQITIEKGVVIIDVFDAERKYHRLVGGHLIDVLQKMDSKLFE